MQDHDEDMAVMRTGGVATTITGITSASNKETLTGQLLKPGFQRLRE